MNEIKVSLLNSTKEGRLYYQNNPEIEPFVIFLHNNLKIKRTYSINIDSAIILDINENHVLQGAEFIIHKNVWKIDPKIVVPHPPENEADIRVENLIAVNELIETPVQSITDDKYRYVIFDWGADSNHKKWIYLSEKVYAAISDANLTGFYINLQPTNHEH